jgi:hypothetical protein
MGYEGVRVFWDANGTVIERSDGKKSPTVDFPFTEDLFIHVRNLAEIPPDKMTINDKLHRMHDFVDPNIWRRMNRAVIPAPLRWGFMPSLVERNWNADHILWKINQNIPFNPFISEVDYDTYIAPYSLTGDGINALRRSSELEFKNTVNTGMPWTVRWDLANALAMIRQYLDPKYGILLNPDLKRVSASHIKPTGWIFSESGGFLPIVAPIVPDISVKKELPVVVDDDDYLVRLAEHLGYIAFSTVSEDDAKEQRARCTFANELPGRRNGNGQIIYGCPLVEIPGKIAQLRAA